MQQLLAHSRPMKEVGEKKYRPKTQGYIMGSFMRTNWAFS